MSDQATNYQRPAELLQNLIRFDTTNPPGNEAVCIGYINDLLTGAGIETTIVALDDDRPNLIARLKGQGNAPPLLLYGHVDVVTTENQDWEHPPFEGKIIDGYIWGRGTLDMKGGLAMMLSAFLRAKAENIPLPGDVIFAAVSDEEAGGDYGAKYLVENHADLFQGVRYALGEAGGFSLYVSGRKFYPIMIAEKQICWMKAALRGPGGHGSMPVRGGAMAKMAAMLDKLDRHRLPVHIAPSARMMFEAFINELPFPTSLVVRLLLTPALTDLILNLLGEQGQLFAPMLHNTVSPTIVHASDKVNVIPSEVSVELDGRLLPGLKPDDMLRELRQILGGDVELEVIRHDTGPPEPDMGLFDTLVDVMKEIDPEGIPMPLLMSGVTDGRWFAQLGIQTYGFTPMQLPKDFNFRHVAHAANERIPVDSVVFGADAIYEVLQRFGE